MQPTTFITVKFRLKGTWGVTRPTSLLKAGSSVWPDRVAQHFVQDVLKTYRDRDHTIPLSSLLQFLSVSSEPFSLNQVVASLILVYTYCFLTLTCTAVKSLAVFAGQPPQMGRLLLGKSKAISSQVEQAVS